MFQTVRILVQISEPRAVPGAIHCILFTLLTGHLSTEDDACVVRGLEVDSVLRAQPHQFLALQLVNLIFQVSVAMVCSPMLTQIHNPLRYAFANILRLYAQGDIGLAPMAL